MTQQNFTGCFANEKRFQSTFGLKNRPERFQKRENARLYLFREVVTSEVVAIVEENPDGFIPGYYIMTASDASRLNKQSDGLFTIVSRYRL